MPIEEAKLLRQSRSAEIRGILAPLLATQTHFTLEVGCGHGHFLTGYAEAHPNEFCIGIDLLEDRLTRAGRKSLRRTLPNIAWIHAEAGLFLDVLPPHVTLAQIFVLFPDPWPKRRHHKNRILQAGFLDKLAQHSTEATRLFFRTDHAPYFATAKSTIESHPAWHLDELERWPFELVTVFQQRAAAYHSLVANHIRQ